MLIEISKGIFVEKSKVVAIVRSRMPPDDILNAGKPCVSVYGVAEQPFRCFSGSTTEVEQHFNWLLSQFDIVRIPESDSNEKVKSDE